MDISYWLAFIAGVFSFLSPCVLPLVPGYISFLSGVSLEELRGGTDRRRVMRKATVSSLFFVSGFSLIFIAFGASASFIGKFLVAHSVLFARIAGSVIVLLGLHLSGILKLSLLNAEKRIDFGKLNTGFFGAFIIGLAFGFGWTPCVGPILASILALAATKETVRQGIILLALYSAGMGIPFIITGMSIGLFMRFFERYKRSIQWGERLAGLFLIFLGVLIFTNQLSLLLRWVPEAFYSFAQ